MKSLFLILTLLVSNMILPSYYAKASSHSEELAIYCIEFNWGINSYLNEFNIYCGLDEVELMSEQFSSIISLKRINFQKKLIKFKKENELNDYGAILSKKGKVRYQVSTINDDFGSNNEILVIVSKNYFKRGSEQNQIIRKQHTIYKGSTVIEIKNDNKDNLQLIDYLGDKYEKVVFVDEALYLHEISVYILK